MSRKKGPEYNEIHWRCPRCGHTYWWNLRTDPATIFCPGCGQRLSEQESNYRRRVYDVLRHNMRPNPYAEKELRECQSRLSAINENTLYAEKFLRVSGEERDEMVELLNDLESKKRIRLEEIAENEKFDASIKPIIDGSWDIAACYKAYCEIEKAHFEKEKKRMREYNIGNIIYNPLFLLAACFAGVMLIYFILRLF